MLFPVITLLFIFISISTCSYPIRKKTCNCREEIPSMYEFSNFLGVNYKIEGFGYSYPKQDQIDAIQDLIVDSVSVSSTSNRFYLCSAECVYYKINKTYEIYGAIGLDKTEVLNLNCNSTSNFGDCLIDTYDDRNAKVIDNPTTTLRSKVKLNRKTTLKKDDLSNKLQYD
ncbi:unnamed protein product [Candida verbasci]|uniref:Uncharacterized protein n=1 Tax=Candida verbasci TaxID=1227364 RepID=A0A9W4U0U3_9ASCO|nr:unnamed protein product [Candida verbasci]